MIDSNGFDQILAKRAARHKKTVIVLGAFELRQRVRTSGFAPAEQLPNTATMTRPAAALRATVKQTPAERHCTDIEIGDWKKEIFAERRRNATAQLPPFVLASSCTSRGGGWRPPRAR